MNNKLTEDLGGGLVRTRDTNIPAVETPNARLGVLGAPFQALDIAAAANNVFARPLGVATAPTAIPTPRGGKWLGWFGGISGAPAAGSITVGFYKGATLVHSQVFDSTFSGAVNRWWPFAAPVDFNQNDIMTVRVVSSTGDLNPTTLDLTAWPIVEWEAK